MLSWALTFLVVAIVAAIFGFGGISGVEAAMGPAQVLFVIFLALFLVSLLVALMSRPRPPGY